VSVRWIPLVTAACGTWVARPARTATALAWWRRFQLDDQVRPVPLIRCPLTTSAVGSAGRTLCCSQVFKFYISWEWCTMAVGVSNEPHGMAYS
jgi:hypothetical protein